MRPMLAAHADIRVATGAERAATRPAPTAVGEGGVPMVEYREHLGLPG